MSEELYKEGISEITCIDLSAIAVEKMQKRLLSKGYKGVSLCPLIKIQMGNLLNFLRHFLNVLVILYKVDILGEQTISLVGKKIIWDLCHMFVLIVQTVISKNFVPLDAVFPV